MMKLTMNSSYGRTIMKPVETDMVFLAGGETRIRDYIVKHSVAIKTIDYVRDDFAIVEKFKSLYEHLSQPQIGAFILSVSKRIMNEVICTAEGISAEIHYQDTDSMHIEKEDLPRLGKAFFSKYDRPLIVCKHKKKEELEEYETNQEGLGMFHGDFAGAKGCSQPVSIRSVFCGKKMYMDELSMVEYSTGKVHISEHIRMKGVPSKAIERYVEEHERLESVFDFYESLLLGEKHLIDLTQAGRPFFLSTKGMKTSTRNIFTREVKMIQRQKDRAIIEGIKFGMLPSGFHFSS